MHRKKKFFWGMGVTIPKLLGAHQKSKQIRKGSQIAVINCWERVSAVFLSVYLQWLAVNVFFLNSPFNIWSIDWGWRLVFAHIFEAWPQCRERGVMDPLQIQ